MFQKVLEILYNAGTLNARAKVHIKLIPIVRLISSFFTILPATFRERMISGTPIF